MKHYEDLSDKPFFTGLVKHMASGPVVAMVRLKLYLWMIFSPPSPPLQHNLQCSHGSACFH